MGRKTIRDPGDRGLCSFVLLFPCCFPVFIWRAKVPPAHFAIALLFWVAITSLVMGLVYRYEFHNGETWRVFPGEVRVLDYPRFTETMFCSGVRLEASHGATMFAYPATKPPKLAHTRSSTRLQRRFRLSSDRLVTFSAFLSPHSVLGAGVCSESDALMHLVRGDANLDCVKSSFARTGQVDRNCVLTTTEYVAGDNTSCVQHPWPGQWAKAQTADIPGQFHVVFEADGEEIIIYAVVVLNRRDYEEPEPQSYRFCNGSTSCYLPFHFGDWPEARRVVVLGIGDGDHCKMQVKASCAPNIAIYLLLFLGCPALISAVVLIVTYSMYRKERLRDTTDGEDLVFLRNSRRAEEINAEHSSELRPIIRI